MPIVLNPDTPPAPPSPESQCVAQATASPVIATTVDGFAIPERKRAVSISAGQTAPTVAWTMVDSNGNPVDLTSCAGSITVTLYVRDGAIFSDQPGRCLPQSFAATIVDAASGSVSAVIDPTKLVGPGIYDAEFAVSATSGGAVLFTNLFDLLVERSLVGTGLVSAGPPTRSEIRLRIRDSSRVENRLLDIRAFDDAELAMAIRAAVDDWNDEPPMLRRYTYGVNSYPHRSKWFDGIIARLHLLVGEEQLRNELEVSAGGIQVNDQNKHTTHIKLGQQMLDDYRTWIRRTKVQLNAAQGWSTLRSGYSGRR